MPSLYARRPSRRTVRRVALARFGRSVKAKKQVTLGGTKSYAPTSSAWNRLKNRGPFPAGMSYDFTYSSFNTLLNGAVSTFGTEHVFRLNSLFDPDFSVGGHQPYGFDQVTPIYSRYKVHAVTIEIDFAAPRSMSNATVACQLSAPQDGVVLAGTNVTQVYERPNCVLMPLNDTGSQVVRIVKRLDMWDIIGCTKAQFEADTEQYAPLVSANPAKVCFLRLAVSEPTGGLASIMSVDAYTRITYHSKLWDRKTLAQS